MEHDEKKDPFLAEVQAAASEDVFADDPPAGRARRARYDLIPHKSLLRVAESYGEPRDAARRANATREALLNTAVDQLFSYMSSGDQAAAGSLLDAAVRNLLDHMQA